MYMYICPGILSIRVALLAERADIVYAADHMSPDVVVKEIQSLGFGAELVPEQDCYQEGQLDVTVSLSLSLPPLMKKNKGSCVQFKFIHVVYIKLYMYTCMYM